MSMPSRKSPALAEPPPGWDGTPIPGPSYGPDWDAAVAYGLDMTLIEYALSLTPAERGERLQSMLNVIAELRSSVACAR